MIDYKQLLGQVEEIAKIGSFELDLSTDEWWGSEHLIKILGIPEKERYNRHEFTKRVHPEDKDFVINYFNEAIQERDEFKYEFRCINRNDIIIYVSLICKVFRNEIGEPEKVIGVLQDITERKEYEMELSRYNHLNKEKNEVLNMVAHDLKSPINQILGFLNIFRVESEEKREELINYIEDSCNMSLRIIGEIIETAELENEGYKLKKTKTDINRLIKESIKHLKLNAENKNISINTQFSENIIANVNQTKFERVIDNLLSNAIKFSPEKSEIIIRTYRNDNKIYIDFQDNGIGIDKNDIPKLFDKFQKPRRKGTSGEKSTGLGLSIVKKIIDLHEGEIYVDSEIRKGSKFTVELDAA